MGPVPRGTEEAPAAAHQLYGDQFPLAEAFVAHLATTGVRYGLLGPRELPRLWTRHVLNCVVLSELIPDGSAVIDVGSGAGLPGIALAIARPDLSLTLVEPLERRVAWLQGVTDDLGLDLDLRRARAEEVAGELAAPVVIARAVAPLERLARWGLPLTEPEGSLLAIKGRSAEAELDAARAALARLGAGECDVVTCGSAVLAVPTTVVRVRVRSVGRRARTSGRTHR